VAGQIVAVQTKVGTAAGTFHYTYGDHLGNVVALSNATGGYLANSLARYDPFGNYRTEPPKLLETTLLCSSGSASPFSLHTDRLGSVVVAPPVKCALSCAREEPSKYNPPQTRQPSPETPSPHRARAGAPPPPAHDQEE